MSVLITGSDGQIGSELVVELGRRYGPENIVATDLRKRNSRNGAFLFETLDVTDAERLRQLVTMHNVDEIYHLASLLSVTGEDHPDLAWDVNVNGLKNVLDVAREYGIRVFWPSSIAVFGPATPRDLAPQQTILDPSTLYGVTKVSGELLCRYYFQRYGVDVRSLRYPGLISHTAPPGGGTTDYAVEIFYAASSGQTYECFVRPDTRLPMMYMPDAIRAALELMDAPADAISVRTSYNVSAASFTVEEVADLIQTRVPEFEVRYSPDARQVIADSWPAEVDDSHARKDWGWRPAFDLAGIVDDMLQHLAEKATH